MKKFLASLISIFVIASSTAQTINPSAPAQAGNGLSQAGSTLNVIYGTGANTSKEGNAIDSVTQGGTGLANVPTNNLLLGAGTSPLSPLAPSATIGQVLTTTGAGAVGWATPPTAAVSSVFGQVGAIPDLSGAVTTSGSSVTAFGAGGTSGQFLTSNGASPASWQTYTPPVLSVFTQTGSIPNLSGAITTSGTSATTFGAGGTAGQILTSNGASPATWQTPVAQVSSVFTQTGAVPNLSGAVVTSGTSATTFGAGGSTGQVLMSNGASPATFQALPTTTASAAPQVTGAATTFVAASATATLSAKYATMVSNGGQGISVASPSAGFNLATTGAGGMDTGSAPASGFVAIYFIYNQTSSTLSTLGVNATSTVAPEIYGGANMPSGYAYSALVAVVPTNSSSTFVASYLSGRSVSLARATTYSSGAIVNTWTALSLVGIVPPNATTVTGDLYTSVNNTTCLYHYSPSSIGLGEVQTGINASSSQDPTYPFTVGVVNRQYYYQVTGSCATVTTTNSQYTF